MAKISLSVVLKKRFKIRVVVVLACLLAGAAVFSFWVLRNPKQSKGYNPPPDQQIIIDSSYTFTRNDGQLEYPVITDSVLTYIVCTWYSPDFCGRYETRGYDLSAADVTVDNVTVIMAGGSQFKSMTVQNNGSLTHEAVGYVDVDDTNKRVDFTLTGGDLVLASGGNINVDGKGFAGGNMSGELDKCWREAVASPGKGMGYGNSANNRRGGDGSGEEDEWAGGAGSAANGVNKGAEYCDDNDCKGRTYALFPDINDPSSIGVGSGGGAAYAYKSVNRYDCAIGGNGGGRVKISVPSGKIKIQSDNSHVSANGTDGTEVFGNELGDRAHSGGGSGGAIYLEANDFEFPFLAQAKLGVPAGSDAASYGIFEGVDFSAITLYSDNYYVFQAKGGCFKTSLGVCESGVDGSGGRIRIKKIIPSSNQNATIKKQLLPLQRPAGTANSFNPYALQIDDVIMVELEATNLLANTAATVYDEILRVPGSTAKCDPDKNSIEFVSTNIGSTSKDYDSSNQRVWWRFTPANTDPVKVRYQCRVTE